MLTAEGRLTIREHMMGSALEGLELSAARLWSDRIGSAMAIAGGISRAPGTVATSMRQACRSNTALAPSISSALISSW